ncbi:vesicle-trafficking protein SEC22a isoform X2 [Polypterus senegalus]|uniref:vesicle-trafficking protein SEC22a isoform X2 n=1 Tax=Polypterus senegalus TaxID=55291 RepID=UPI001962605B|nr:vesicle-trafficking protein SEC22a isoform X2 [Polypterus senegalus]
MRPRRINAVLSFTSSLGVGYLMVCTESYPSVLAFCFLDELQMEFIVSYDTNKINGAVRPYSFIEFDHFIQKIKLRYNSPRSLTTKINLADMQTEIKLRPPYQLSTSDIGTLNGFANFSPNKYKGIAPNQMLEPVTLAGVISCMLSLLCGALNLIRGVHAIESVLQTEEEDLNCIVAFFIGTAACFYQCYLLTFCTGWRSLKAAMSFALICLCNLYLYELRNSWQLFFHVTVGAFATLQIRLRQPQGKAPDYNV